MGMDMPAGMKFNLKKVMTNTLLQYFKEHEPQLFLFWDKLSEKEKIHFLQQLESINLPLLQKQKELVFESASSHKRNVEPLSDFAFSGNLTFKKKGQKLIEEGLVGCILLAGGQGTRLGHPGPKGTYPISVIKNKSLFQLFAEKVKAASEKAGTVLPLAIMTSPENHAETEIFFKKNDFFGLKDNQVSFFLQERLPFLDPCGKLILSPSSQIASGPDGNGHSILSFARSGVMDQWLSKGVKFFNVILIDNPLADPFDAELVGYHAEKRGEITLKCAEKSYPQEKVGLVIKEDESIGVIEYSDMSEEEKCATLPNGRLKYSCANLSLFCFSLSFINRMIQEQHAIPLHKSWKAVSSNESSYGWKFETFIFDWLKFGKNIHALIYPREHCFSPLKNAAGVDSPQTVKEALLKRDREIIQDITGFPPPFFPFELCQDFYYPTPALVERWKGKKVTESYTETTSKFGF